MWALALLAQARRNDDPFRQPEVIWGTAGLALALLVGAGVIWGVDRWRKRAADATTRAGELTDFRGMYERGEITEEEYARLRNQVADRVKGPPKPAPPPGGAAGFPVPPRPPGPDSPTPPGSTSAAPNPPPPGGDPGAGPGASI